MVTEKIILNLETSKFNCCKECGNKVLLVNLRDQACNAQGLG